MNKVIDDSNFPVRGERLDIFTYPSPILSKKALPVEVFDEKLLKLTHDMLYTMYHAPGIGLAAPQIGISQRIFVIDVEYEREEVTMADESVHYRYHSFSPLVLINPKLTLISGEILYDEGCLSVPGIYEEVKRTEKIKIEYQDLKGEHQTLEADGLLSVCLQHENDHLDGIVFIDRLSFLKKDLVKKKILKEKKKKQL